MCDRCEELQEEVRQLRELMAPSDVVTPDGCNLSPAEAAVFSALLSAGGKLRSNNYLFQVTRDFTWSEYRSGARAAPDPDSLVKVYISKIRRKLRETGAPYEIRLHWARGYSLHRTDVVANV